MKQEYLVRNKYKYLYDYTRLLIYRAEHPNDKDITAAVKKAISEVDNISEDALNALTIAFSITSFMPTSGFIEDGLSTIDTLFSKLLEKITLPSGTDWVDNLETVNAIRVNQFGHLKTYEEIAQTNFSGYFVLGIKKDSEDFKKARDFLKTSNIPTGIMINNTLCDGYARIAIPSFDKLDGSGLVNPKTSQLNKFTPKQIESLKNIIALYIKSDEDYDKMKNNFNDLLLSYKNIASVKEWWDRIAKTDISFGITSIGRVLANTNARRIESSLPELKS